MEIRCRGRFLLNELIHFCFFKQIESAIYRLISDPDLRDITPLGELTDFAEGISMRAVSESRLESTFVCRQEHMQKNRKLYLSGMGLRIARDLLACLPVEEVAVTAEDEGTEVFCVTYTRQQLLHRNFAFTDPILLAKESGAEFK